MTEPVSSRAALLVLALAFAQPACSGADPDPNQAKTAATHEKRDTEVKHEPCDAASASARKVDINGDGKPDIVHVMSGEREICRIADLNLDGSYDVFIYYDAQGKERRRESDFDRDGRADEISVYEGGVIKLKMRETNFDNKLDTWDYYEGGKLTRRERDSDGDGIIDQWWQFNNPTNPKCAIVASDRNADGKPDPESVVDLCGESYTGLKQPPPGAATPPGAPPATSASAPPKAPIPPPAPPQVAPPPAPTAPAPAKPPAPEPPKK